MKKVKTTYYTFVLDKSGSMGPICDQTISNFNEQIDSLKMIEEEFPNQKHLVSLITFNGMVETVFVDRELRYVEPLTKKEYFPRGGTALYDAVGEAVSSLKNRRKTELKKRKTNSAFIMILTDGYENSSMKYSQSDLKEMIEDVESKANWDVNFIGTTKESISQARGFGIDLGKTVMFSDTAEGMGIASKGISNALYTRAAYSDSNVTNDAGTFSYTTATDGTMDVNLDLASLKSDISAASSDAKNK